MCHLSVEKALKGLYQQTPQETPPKTHNLIYLVNKIGLKPSPDNSGVIARLNEASIGTRYPEHVDKLQGNYTQEIAVQILAQAKEILEWIKRQF
jgi:HEPN domain-containing protein